MRLSDIPAPHPPIVFIGNSAKTKIIDRILVRGGKDLRPSGALPKLDKARGYLQSMEANEPLWTG